MRASEILRRAAERVHGGLDVGGCDAIYAVNHNSGVAQSYILELYFGPYNNGNPEHDKVWGCPWDVYFWGLEPREEARVIGLCLAAAVAEADGL